VQCRSIRPFRSLRQKGFTSTGFHPQEPGFRLLVRIHENTRMFADVKGGFKHMREIRKFHHKNWHKSLLTSALAIAFLSPVILAGCWGGSSTGLMIPTTAITIHGITMRLCTTRIGRPARTGVMWTFRSALRTTRKNISPGGTRSTKDSRSALS